MKHDPKIPMTAAAARTAELVRTNAEARRMADLDRTLRSFVSDLNAAHRLDSTILNAEQAIARKRAAETTKEL